MTRAVLSGTLCAPDPASVGEADLCLWRTKRLLGGGEGSFEAAVLCHLELAAAAGDPAPNDEPGRSSVGDLRVRRLSGAGSRLRPPRRA